jgi:hemoglobin-like flavoprotein
MDPESEGIKTNRRFLAHASYMIDMLDRALNMLGPDVELLQEILSDRKFILGLFVISLIQSPSSNNIPSMVTFSTVGKKHARMGVREAYFPFMGQALIETLRETLGETSFTPEVEESWHIVYEGLSTAMVQSMNSEASVLTSWAKLKTVPEYDKVAGTKLFQYLFRKCPEAKALFGFPLDLDTDCDIMMKSRRFQMHAKYFIEMLDKALAMVETKQMEQNMKELGELHVSFGVKESYFPIMGDALLHALSETLPEENWNPDIKAAWHDVYDRLSSSMISAMKQAGRK